MADGDNETLTALNEGFDKLATRLAALVPAAPVVKADPPAAPPKTYSRAELRQAVEDSKISQDQADEIWDRQTEARITQTVSERVRGETLTQTVEQKRDAYFSRHAELNDPTSAAFKRVDAIFTDLMKNGSPKTVATELAALKIAFPDGGDLGPGETVRGTSPEIGGGGSPPRGRNVQEKDTDPPADLNARQRQHYERLVGPGNLYPDWKAVREELKHAKPSARTRAA
ncbi:MAG: hypothetical protein WA210_20305 [Burkholderiaceae bacterium]